MIVKVDGWRGAGKSVLWTLLDGHSKIFCSPLHDQILKGFLTKNDDNGWIFNKDIKTVRMLLKRTNYYHLELTSRLGHYQLDFNAEGDNLKIPFPLDFYKMDQEFFDRITNLDKWNIEILCKTFYNTLYRNYDSQIYS